MIADTQKTIELTEREAHTVFIALTARMCRLAEVELKCAVNGDDESPTAHGESATRCREIIKRIHAVFDSGQ